MLKKLPVPFILILFAGIAMGFILSFKAVIPYLYWGEMDQFIWHRSALPHMINYLFWPVLVPLIYWTLKRYNLGKEANAGDRIKTIGLSLAIPFIHELVTTFIYFVILETLDIYSYNEETWPQIQAAFPGVYIGRVVEFWIIYGIFAAFDYYKRLKDKQAELGRIEAQLTRTKLEVLKMQLQPHFLFNALNSISSLMEIDIKKAQEVTARLGDLLRGILEQDNRIFVSLEEEINYVKTYLEIEQIRFDDRLNVKYDVDSNVLNYSVPLLLVQPLAENAVKHGVAKVSRKGTITVSAKMIDGELNIVVSDDFKGQEQSVNRLYRNGIGLRNIKERLKALYEGKASMFISTALDRGFSVELRLPKSRNYAHN